MIDWDFKTEDSRSFVHNFCWYPSRFIPIIPAHIIRALSKEGDTILDPYCGSGTSILESLKLNRNAIGIDLNPIACFITKVKISVLKKEGIDIKCLQQIASSISSSSSSGGEERDDLLFTAVVNDAEIPNKEENESWYHPDTLRMLSHIHQTISEMGNGATKDLCLLFFYSILIPASGHENRRPYTYYADNCKPKIKIFKNAFRLFVGKITKFLKEYQSHFQPSCNDASIFNIDIRNIRGLLADHGPVDLIVTSPPYLSVTDYTTAYRLVYLWDDFENSMDLVKQNEIGARWRRKQPARMTQYMDAIHTSISDMAFLLKTGGYIALILGESKKHSLEIMSTIESYAVKTVGLTLVETFSRNVSKNYFISQLGGVPTEDIMVFQKVAS